LPESAQLLVYAVDESTALRPFTALDNRDHGELWVPHLDARDVVLELRVARAEEAEVDLELTSIQQGYRGMGSSQSLESSLSGGALESLPALSGACHVDVACPQGNRWRDQARAVALFSIGGTLACSGTMLNNTRGDLRPLYLTANHCGIIPDNDQSVVVHFNYENSFCRTPGSAESGRVGNGSRNRFVSGSTHLAAWTGTDFTLVELHEAPNPSWNVFWAGWDRTNAAPSSAVGIHHPGREEKRISIENDPLAVTTLGEHGSPGDGRSLRVLDWDEGSTEGGSSGSGLFNAQGRLVGHFRAGAARCGNDSPGWYGRFAASWDGGGSAANRLRDWLDPLGPGVRNLNGTYRATVNPDPDPDPDPDPTLEAPSDLNATPASSTEIRLTWQDNSEGEGDFLVQQRAAGDEDHRTIAVLPADSTSVLAGGLAPGTEYFFRVRARRGSVKSAFTPEVGAFTLPAAAPPAPPARLVARSTSTSGIFLTWQDEAQGETGFEIEMSGDGLEFTLEATVPANTTGATVSSLPSLAHRSFRVRAVNESGTSAYSNVASATTDGMPGACVEDETTLCLKDERFQVSVLWTTAAQGTHPAMAEELTEATGYFWFFSDTNIEIVLKALEGCPSNGHFWIFATGLTNIGVEVLVVDTATGKAQTYVNRLGEEFPAVLDTQAFATCP